MRTLVVIPVQPHLQRFVQTFQIHNLALVNGRIGFRMKTAVQELKDPFTFPTPNWTIWLTMGQPDSQPGTDVGEVLSGKSGSVIATIPNSE